MKSTGRLDGKVVIVTGGGSGFGEAIARRFGEEGAAVVIADISEENGRRVANALSQVGARSEFVRTDVSRDRDMQALAAAATDRFGGLSIMVNNAGTTHRNQPALEVSEAEFDRIYSVNVKSIYLSAKHVVPHFRARGGGVFVNIASTTGVRPGPGLAWYSGSKGAVITLSRALALELARDRIRVNVVNPMIGETAMLEDFMGAPDTPENRQRFLARIPLGRFTRPMDVAHAALYLASDEAEFVTGICLDVDGGRNI